MPRRLKLSPIQRDIMMMLEEAGAETIGTVIATLKPSDQGEFAGQVDHLVTLGLISKEDKNLVLTEQGRMALRTQASAQFDETSPLRVLTSTKANKQRMLVQRPDYDSDELGRILRISGKFARLVETPMYRFSPLLFALAMSTSLSAQSTVDWANLDEKSTMEIVAVTKYCANVEDYSNSQVPRIFARTTSVYGQSAGWVEYDTRAAWRQAGRPEPVALVWYRDAKIVRVKISSSDDESPRAYADYCYRKDGSLARLRSEPSVRRKCQPNGSQCTLVLREVRLYPPEGRVLTTYGVDIHLNADSGLIIEQESAGAERIVENFVPLKWPEYRNVTDLPFSELLYTSLR